MRILSIGSYDISLGKHMKQEGKSMLMISYMDFSRLMVYVRYWEKDRKKYREEQVRKIR